MTTRRKKILFRFQTRMFKVGHNYGNKIKCPLCKMENDTQEHMFDCVIMKIHCINLYSKKDENHEDIFSLNTKKLEDITKICESISRTHELLLCTPP